jgi:Zn-dependent peptidase ImmA (M78 family)
MVEEAINIDEMALADIGQPGRLALELHRQMRVQFGTVPTRVPLHGIAKAVGIVDVQDYDVDKFLGTLVIKEGRGAIGLQRGLQSGRRNFTLGHEIGHFLIPTHRLKRTNFECTKSDISRVRSGNLDSTPPLERIEIEANEFAATLLIPGAEYKVERKKLGKSPNVRHIRELARTFDVSQEMMASTYVRMEDTKLAVVISQNGIVKRIIPCANFPYMGLRKDTPLPPNCLTKSYIGSSSPGTVSDMQERRTDAWLETGASVSALYEQVLIQEKGWATTLLSIDEDEIDDEDDDRNWNRRNIPR